MHRVLQITLLAVVLLVILLVTAQLTGNSLILNLGGLVGLIAGGLTLYIGMAQVINEVYGNRIFPV
jgi:succinate-acetate transporter protein